MTQQVQGPRRKLVFGIVVSLASTVVALALAEGALRVLVPEADLISMHEADSWKLRVRESLEDGKPVRSGDTQYDADLGWRMKAGYAAAGVHHDAHGFRGTRQYSVKQAGVRRVLVLGASFAYGDGVRDEETFTSLLEASTGAEVINAGVNAYGLDQALLLWERDGQRLAPDHVLLVIHVDDYYRSALTFRNGPKPHFVRAGDTFELAGVPAPAPDTLAATGVLDVPSRLRIVRALGWLMRRARRQGREDALDGREAERLEALNAFILTRLRDSVRSSGAQLTIALGGHCAEPHAYPFSERAIARLARTLSIPLVDTIEPMARGDYPSFFGANCHWSARGHAFVAGLLERPLGR